MVGKGKDAGAGHEPEDREGPLVLQRADKLGGGGTAGHLSKAGPAGGGANETRIDADGPRRAVGNGEAIAEGGKGHGDKEGGRRENADDGSGKTEKAAEQGHAVARQHHAVDADALGRNISKAVTGELTPQQALDEAAEEWVKIVQKLGIDKQKAQYANFLTGARKLGYKI